MSTAVDTQAHPLTRKLSFLRVVKSELLKLRTLRSTWIMLLVMLVLFIAFGALAALSTTGQISDGSGTPPPKLDPVTTVLAGAGFAVLVMSVFGVLSGAREYSSGMIRATLSFVPRRLYVLGGKAIALVVFVIPVTLVAALGAFVLGMAVLSAAGSETASLTDADSLRVLIGTTINICGLALIGLALGMAMRSMPGAIATVIGVVLILPGLLTALLPESWRVGLKFLPSNAIAGASQIDVPDGMLGLWPGLLVFLAWVVACLVLAGFLLVRRDA